MIVLSLGASGSCDGSLAGDLGDTLAGDDTEATQVIGADLVIVKDYHQQHGSIHIHTLWFCNRPAHEGNNM